MGDGIVVAGRVLDPGKGAGGVAADVPEKATLGSIMKDTRIEGKLRQIDLAEAIGVAVDRVSHIENNRSPVPIELFVEWCQQCNRDPAKVLKRIVNELR